MRAGPLSDKDLIEKLNADFINTWIIIPQFEKPEEFFQDTTARKWASTIQAEFTYPVDSIVLSSTGDPIGQGEFQEVNSAKTYKQMLGKLKK